MGLNKDSGRKNFLTIGNGKIVLQHQNPIEGVTTQRVNKNGKTVHEEIFTSVTAMIANIQSKDTTFGKVWEIELTDNSETYVLSFNYSSRYTNNFFRALPNIDLSQPVKIAPWTMADKKDSSKTVIGLSISQNGNKVPFKWDKDNPGNLPEMEQIKRKGKLEWDDSKQLEFFEDMLKKEILPQLKSVPAGASDDDDNEPAPF
jgi:hypothetical protein